MYIFSKPELWPVHHPYIACTLLVLLSLLYYPLTRVGNYVALSLLSLFTLLKSDESKSLFSLFSKGQQEQIYIVTLYFQSDFSDSRFMIKRCTLFKSGLCSFLNLSDFKNYDKSEKS